MDILNPAGWKRPKGYSNAVAASGRHICVAGQVGWNAREEFETDDLAGQVRQALRNIVAVLAEGGAGPEHVARMTWYVVDKREYLAAERDIGQAYREVMGRNYPAMTLVQVADLLEDRARVEIEVTAIVPHPADAVAG
ncbi:MAG: RidA family protein [Alphaproteobacteria bacterium]|nr:RidA family protein [Alphaproteobacteria bacterium]